MGFSSCISCWSAGNENPTAAGGWGTESAHHAAAVQLLKLSLLGNWDGGSVEGNALLDTVSQAFESIGGSNDYKDYRVS